MHNQKNILIDLAKDTKKFVSFKFENLTQNNFIYSLTKGCKMLTIRFDEEYNDGIILEDEDLPNAIKILYSEL